MFKLIKKLDNGVRIGELSAPHGKIHTPFFMPVGTVGSVKGVSSEELNQLGAEIVLSNTYHLYLRPGEELIKNLGGLHSFMRWNKPILTDSGGYQVFSLSDRGKDKKSLVKVSEEGVEFKSHLDGSSHMFTPEKVIQIQLDLGVDILMPLDICPNGKASHKEVEEACRITTLWAKTAKDYFKYQISNIKYHNENKPMLHGIVQGGLYEDLRRKHAKEITDIGFDGYSIGGLAVDSETRDMWDVVKLMGEILPEDKQRYLMGVGTPDDIIRATKLGVDMFDCVLPTRLGRHGNVYVKSQKSNLKDQKYTLVNLLKSEYRTDADVIDKDCGCPACSGGYSRAYISHLLRSGEILGIRLTTLHNLYTYLELMRNIRES